MREASIRKITTRVNLINWLDELPVGITHSSFKHILKEYKHYRYVVWTYEDGFMFLK